MNVVAKALIAGAFVSIAVPAAAQTVQKPQAAQTQVRQQIAAFEAALETAVRYGTQMLDQRLQASSAANMVMLAGMTRARGFRLEDYGIVFDVEFPSMRRSMVWSLQELERGNVSAASGRAVRAAETSNIKPREIYQTEITEALMNAVLDYSGPVGIGADEWLTIAARESLVDRRFIPGDPTDTAITVILRIKGSDLQGLREQRLTREDARKRIDVKQY